MNKKNKVSFNKFGKIYVFGIMLVCGLLLTSVDDCENMELMEQQYAREQAAQAEQAKAAKAEQEKLASSGKSDSQSPQKQTTSGTQQGSQAASGDKTASSASQPASGSTSSGTQAATDSGSGTQPAASGTQAPSGGTTPAGTQPAAASTGANYVTSISGKAWKLTELRFSDRTVALNRGELNADQADIFTITVDNERVSGKAAPNRYFGPYQAGANNALTIQPVANTMMAAIFTDPQKITEQQYLQYLTKVKSWKVNQNKLELTSTDAANKPVTMVFSN